MNIEIKITADALTDAISKLADAIRLTATVEKKAVVIASVDNGELKLPKDSKLTITKVERSEEYTPRSAPAIAQGGELTLPAGTDLTVAAVSRNDVTLVSDPTVEPMKAPEKPKRTRKTAKPAESAQENAGEQEALQPEQVTPEPEPAAEAPVEAPSEPAPTLDRIAAAGAKLLDDNPNAMTPLLDLLKDYDVQAITQLKADQLAGFAARLRELGAEV